MSDVKIKAIEGKKELVSEEKKNAYEATKDEYEGYHQAKDAYEGTYTLKDSAKMMFDYDYKKRFIAEYVQLKVRYEKLNILLSKWQACWQRFGKEECCVYEPGVKEESEKELIEWLGLKPTCSMGLLQRQFRAMEDLLHTLEIRAAVEGIDLSRIQVSLL